MKEDNKLIADFMGLIKVDDDEFDFYQVENIVLSNRFILATDVLYCSIEELPFHLSYEYLMLVVEEIEKIKNIHVRIDYKSCRIINFKNSYISTNEDTKLKAVYKAIVEFIKEYNKK